MTTRFLGALCLLAGSLLAACGEDTTKPPTTAPAPGGGSAVTPTTPPTTPPAATVAQAATIQAQKLIDEATGYIKDKKWDLADKAIKQLEEMKPNLPAEYGPRIDTLRSSFNAAKGGSLPGGFSLPK